MTDPHNLIRFPGKTKGDIPVDAVLSAAQKCKHVLVIGQLEDGEFYAASSCGSDFWLVTMAEKFKHDLLAGEFE